MTESVVNVVDFGAEPASEVRRWRKPRTQAPYTARKVPGRQWWQRPRWHIGKNFGPAFSAALAALPKIGGTVLLPPGTYFVDNTLTLEATKGCASHGGRSS